MPELLGVTNPTPAHDAALNNRNLPVPPSSLPISNISDPSRVNRSDGRTEQEDAGTKERLARFGSNFQAFLQRLVGSTDIVASLSSLFSGKSSVVVASGMGEGIAEEMGRFLQMLKMDRGEFVRFLTNQVQAGTRFGGALFTLLRSAYQKAESDGLRGDILQFLKRYSDHSSTPHVEGNLLRNLQQMARAIPARFGNHLIELTAQLENGIRADDRAGNIKLLQGEILPFMSEYVSRTHDLGRARGLLSLLSLDITRYESGTEQQLLQSFQLLKSHPALRDTLGMLDDQALLVLLKNSTFLKAAQENTFASNLAKLADRAARGAGGPEMQKTFRELISAFLINESVYMPLNHLIIPLEWQGKYMFSELWVDPDAEPENRRPNGETTQRFLFKIDIQSLGFFDLVLTCRGTSVELQLRCPEQLGAFTGLFADNMTRILNQNGLQAGAVQVKPAERPLKLTEVFPKLFEGKDSVNVKV